MEPTINAPIDAAAAALATAAALPMTASGEEACAEVLAADATRCLSHAAGIYVFNSTHVADQPRPASRRPEHLFDVA